MTPTELSIAFFAQMAAILLTCRIVGWIGRRFLAQPQVVGEMIAGVLLGPSALALAAPEFQAILFPPETRGVLFVGAQLGVGLYMFLVGLGFERSHFEVHGRSAVAVSFAGMAAPFLMAVVLTPWLLAVDGLFSPDATRFEATLFMGAAISITAFPMLARIIHERGITDTPLGTLSLSAGAIGDAVAWMVLAVVVASFGGRASLAVVAIAGGIGFALFMLLLGPRLLAPLGRWAERDGGVGHTLLAVTLIAFMLCAFAMDFIGIHAVFGGFVLGCVMPRGTLAREIRARLEPITVVLLLPMFFTYSGLNTRLSMVDSLPLLGVAAAILGASIIAKGAACWAAARLTGQDNPTAMAIGALMNARGLMELIIINIGLQRGIIGPALFSVLVLMAIVTTLMASPLFEAVYGRGARRRGELGTIRDARQTTAIHEQPGAK